MDIKIKDNSLALTTLDQDTLKQSLKNYLKNQNVFRGYDFEASDLNVLLSLLSYNTSMLAFFTNMNISESWLDSAQLRDSLSSHAKDLNYLPRSARSPLARVRVTFQATGGNQPYTIEKGASFTTQVKNLSYQYTIPETLVVSSSNTTFQFETDIYEGTYLKESYIYQAGVENQRFRISNKNIDTRSIAVSVFEDNSSEALIFTNATTLLGLNEKSKVFFLQPAENGYYEILFGDGIVGREPKTNAVIVIDYRVTEGEVSNGARTFSINFDPSGGELTDAMDVLTLTVSENGKSQESNESIRFYAPRHFQVQERAVNEYDYEIMLKTNFPEINAISVFGGDLLTPPKFGKVYIAVDITDIDGIPQSKIDLYTNFIKTRNPLAITPVFIEPQMLYWGITSEVRFNINITDISAQRIKSLVTQTIMDFNEDNLDDFNSYLKFSKLIAAIDDSDTSISGNATDLVLYRKFNPILNNNQNLIFSFDQPINSQLSKRAINSTLFTYQGVKCKFIDIGGAINIINARSGKTIKKIGTINYKTGRVRILNFKPSLYEGSALKIYGIPANKDILSKTNDILTIEPDEINVQIKAIRE